MSAVVAVLLLVAAAVVVAAAARPLMRRRRWRRCLADASREVEAAMGDGRLRSSTGEALLQHLEGLSHECAGREED